MDQIFEFLSSKESLEKALEWLKASKITVDGKDLYDLNTSHKYTILKKVFRSSAFSSELKQ